MSGKLLYYFCYDLGRSILIHLGHFYSTTCILTKLKTTITSSLMTSSTCILIMLWHWRVTVLYAVIAVNIDNYLIDEKYFWLYHNVWSLGDASYHKLSAAAFLQAETFFFCKYFILYSALSLTWCSLNSFLYHYYLQVKSFPLIEVKKKPILTEEVYSYVIQ